MFESYKKIKYRIVIFVQFQFHFYLNFGGIVMCRVISSLNKTKLIWEDRVCANEFMV